MNATDRPLHLRHSASSPNVRKLRATSASTPTTVAVAHEQFLNTISKAHRPQEIRDTRVEDYACNICFEVAENAVVTSCGHLHCWSCLYRWLTLPTQLACPICPVCKAGCDIASLTPIYGRGEHESVVKTSKVRTLSSSSQYGPKNILDQWLVPHMHPPTLPILPDGETPARPMARRNPPVLRKNINIYTTHGPSATQPSSIFGNTHPVVIFSAGITTLCGMQILNNGGFASTTTDFGTQEDHTSKMMWLLACAIIAGVWFH